MLFSLEVPDLVFQFPHPLQGSVPLPLGRKTPFGYLGYFVVSQQVAAVRWVVPAELPALPAQVQPQRRAVAPVAGLSALDNFDGMVFAA